MENMIEVPELEQENVKLKSRINELKNKNTELQALIKFYEEQIRLAKHKQFGSSSEKTESSESEQLGLFDEVENTADKNIVEPTLEEITYKRKRHIGKREEDLSGLPVEMIEYTLPESEQICPECGGNLHVMTKEIRRELTIIPAQVKVTEHVLYVYSCRNCEKNSTDTPIIRASAPEPVIKGSLASPSTVAHIMVQKYVMATPLYRQEQSFLRDGISLSRQTMANWLIKCSEDWLEPVYERMKTLLLQEAVLHADETVLQVLKEPGKKANANSYEWLYRTSGDSKHPVILYEYQPTRSSSHPERFLTSFNGYLHTDGYAGYHRLPKNITVVGCWAHVRRKFDEALKSVSAESRIGSNTETGLNFCNRLFDLEREFKELSSDERYKKRLEKSLPVAEAFFAWANSFGEMAKTGFRNAIEYFIGQWSWLKNIFLDGRLELSNNRAERSIKPFVIGRKNWLFCNSQKGAKASSVIYSIIETAKENGLKPFEYFKLLLERLPNAKMSEIDGLLPWGQDVQVKCKMGCI